MTNFITALIQQPFLQHALLGSVLASLACGLIGPFVVVKRISYIAGGIAHTALGGMGIAYFLSADPLWGALISAILAALLIGYISLHSKQYEDILIGALWAAGMAVGILFISKAPGYNTDLMSYLFGNILMISKHDLLLIGVLLAGLAILSLLFNKYFVAVCFDEEFAKTRGVNVTAYYLLLLVMVAITVVMLIQIVGLILVIALLTIPAAIANGFVKSIAKMMFWAGLLGMVFTTAGLSLAYELNLAVGATIILVCVSSFIIALLINKTRCLQTP